MFVLKKRRIDRHGIFHISSPSTDRCHAELWTIGSPLAFNIRRHWSRFRQIRFGFFVLCCLLFTHLIFTSAGKRQWQGNNPFQVGSLLFNVIKVFTETVFSNFCLFLPFSLVGPSATSLAINRNGWISMRRLLAPSVLGSVGVNSFSLTKIHSAIKKKIYLLLCLING